MTIPLSALAHAPAAEPVCVCVLRYRVQRAKSSRRLYRLLCITRLTRGLPAITSALVEQLDIHYSIPRDDEDQSKNEENNVPPPLCQAVWTVVMRDEAKWCACDATEHCVCTFAGRNGSPQGQAAHEQPGGEAPVRRMGIR